MAHEVQVHQAQTAILRELLFVDSAGFAALQKPTGLTSDHFKFHIARLVELEYVEKLDSGQYRLSGKGKEYASKLDTDSNTIEKQPKSSVILVVEKVGADGRSLFVVQERRKHPYFGFWGFPSGKIRWGETILAAAARELMEETGLTATPKHMGIYHEQVAERESGQMLEDKIFHIVHCSAPEGQLKAEFDSGHNIWTSLEDARAREKRYNSFDIEVAIGLDQERFVEKLDVYSKEQF
jgi:ADP-ribose pyrophosphatase YjhB (NUDIX family)